MQLKVKTFFITFLILSCYAAHSQSELSVSNRRVVGYLSFNLPIVTIDKNNTTTNFTNGTSIGFPTGVNILYSESFGFSFEFTPIIRSGNGTSRVSNLLFHPGPIFRLKNGFAFISRLAFETSGRYGVTPVLSKVLASTKSINYFTAVGVPARFGNSSPASVGATIQFGFTFN